MRPPDETEIDRPPIATARGHEALAQASAVLRDIEPEAPSEPRVVRRTAASQGEATGAALMRAARALRAAEISQLLAAGVDPLARDYAGRSALHHIVLTTTPGDASAGRSATACVGAFLDVALDVIDAQDESGDTPLHIAVRRGDESMVQLLLSNAAEVRATSQHHPPNSPSPYLHPESCALVLAQPMVANAAGQTPLSLAECQSEACAALLREYSRATADSIEFLTESRTQPSPSDGLASRESLAEAERITAVAPRGFPPPPTWPRPPGGTNTAPHAEAAPPPGFPLAPAWPRPQADANAADLRRLPNADGDSDTGVDDSDAAGPSARVISVQKLSDERRREWQVRRARRSALPTQTRGPDRRGHY